MLTTNSGIVAATAPASNAATCHHRPSVRPPRGIAADGENRAGQEERQRQVGQQRAEDRTRVNRQRHVSRVPVYGGEYGQGDQQPYDDRVGDEESLAA
jgi:hypothetical protein